MYLGAYTFDGDPADLLPAYERLMAGYPDDSIELHVCVVHPGGLTVLDACPSREVFTSFSGSDEFRAALGAAGLPAPRIEQIGDVHRVRTREGVAP